MLALVSVLAAVTNITDISTLNPNSSALPLSGLIVQAKDSIGWLALIAALVGLLISAGLWAIGSYSNNFQQTVNGKRGVLVCAAAAVVVGIGPHLISFLYIQGHNAH